MEGDCGCDRRDPGVGEVQAVQVKEKKIWKEAKEQCEKGEGTLVRFPNPLATDIHGSWGT